MKFKRTLLAAWIFGVLQSHGAVQLLGYQIPTSGNERAPTITTAFVSGTDLDDNNGTVPGGDFTVSPTSGTAFVRQVTSSDSMVAQFTATTLTESIDRGVYIEFIATVQAESADLTSLTFSHQSQDLDADVNEDFESNLAVFASLNGFGGGTPSSGDELDIFTLSVLGSANRDLDLTSGGAFDGLLTGTEISFRFYEFSPDGSKHNQVTRLDNIILNGNAVPEPSAALLCVTALAGMMLRRKR